MDALQNKFPSCDLILLSLTIYVIYKPKLYQYVKCV